MSSNGDASWMPNGRHKLNIGSSLGTMLKARKGQSKRNNNLPVRDFYSFRYNFKPTNVDTSKTGSIEVTKKTDTTTVVVEHASTQPGDAYTFSGTETPARELDCLLIYDEELGSFTLEKIDSLVVLQHGKKIASKLPVSQPSPSVAPSPVEPPPSTVDTPQVDNDNDDLGADFDAELALLAGDDNSSSHKGSKHKSKNKSHPNSSLPSISLDLEEFDDPIPLPPPPAQQAAPPPPKKKSKVPLPGKNTKRPPATVAPTPKPAPAPPPPPPAITLSSGLEEEDLEFGRPPEPPPKKRRMSEEGLALPGSSSNSGFVQPLPAFQQPPVPLSAAAAAAEESEEEEDEWDEVPVESAGVTNDDGLFGIEGQGEEVDLSDFENELGLALDGADEEDGMVPVPDSSGGSRPILSLNDFAANDSDEDDYSSSDESEEE